MGCCNVGWLTVQCVTGAAEVQIRITDMNDNVPYFKDRIYTARVPENTDAGTVVISVTAEDKDEGKITPVIELFACCLACVAAEDKDEGKITPVTHITQFVSCFACVAAEDKDEGKITPVTHVTQFVCCLACVVAEDKDEGKITPVTQLFVCCYTECSHLDELILATPSLVDAIDALFFS